MILDPIGRPQYHKRRLPQRWKDRCHATSRPYSLSPAVGPFEVMEGIHPQKLISKLITLWQFQIAIYIYLFNVIWQWDIDHLMNELEVGNWK